MAALLDQHRLLGETGLSAPPIVFGTSALGNVGRVITEQSKLAICGEWFQKVAPPVMIEVAYEHGNGMALEVLGRILQRMEIGNDEVILCLSVGRSELAAASDVVHLHWEKSCRLLGDDYCPKLISIAPGSEDALQAAIELKAAGDVRGIGLEVSDGSELNRAAAAEADWFSLRGGFTIMRHGPELLKSMVSIDGRHIPIIVAGVFERGFLVGGNRLDGRVLSSEDTADRSLLAWRKSFVALCDGHGISPAHACVQFGLSAPGVVAVTLESSYADRVAENVAAVTRSVPPNLWQSMKEEGLLAEDYPIGDA
jgi:D-threo-aldose 1-dehydrogenase